MTVRRTATKVSSASRMIVAKRYTMPMKTKSRPLIMKNVPLRLNRPVLFRRGGARKDGGGEGRGRQGKAGPNESEWSAAGHRGRHH